MNQPNENQLAQMALELLNRVDLKGVEVPGFLQVRQWLHDKAQPGPEEVNDGE